MLNRTTRGVETARIIESLVSPRTGIIGAVRGPYAPLGLEGLWKYSAYVGTERSDLRAARIGGGAVAWDRRHAFIAALAEGVERYVWSQPSGQPHMLTLEQIERDAIHPREFLGDTLAARDADGAASGALRGCADVPWLAGHDLLSGRRRWVPAGTVVVGYKHPPNHGYDCDTTTTGMAVGSDAGAAMLAGATEVIERDAYMVTHVGRLQLPEIDLRSVPSLSLQSLLDQIADRRILHIRAWDMTLDTRVPTVLCAAIFDVDGEPSIRIAAATRLSPLDAIQKACAEAVHGLSLTNEDEVRRCRRSTTAASTALHALHDHVSLGDHREYLDSLDWLLHDRSCKRTFQEMEQRYGSADAKRDPLRWLARRLREIGLSAYGFNLTPAEINGLTGLHVWRVIIPGMERLATGRRPVPYSSRIRRAPVRAGLLKEPRTRDELNPLPHCFP